MNKRLLKPFVLVFILGFGFISTACGIDKSFNSDIHAEIQQYEWSEMYVHKKTYQESCELLFYFLPVKLNTGSFENSLIDKNDVMEITDCFIPAYGGKYMSGIPMKNRQSWEDCYITTLEVLRTLHNEYIEMGIIEKKAE